MLVDGLGTKASRAITGALVLLGSNGFCFGDFIGNYGKWQSTPRNIRTYYVLGIWDQLNQINAFDPAQMRIVNGLGKCATATGLHGPMLEQLVDRYYAEHLSDRDASVPWVMGAALSAMCKRYLDEEATGKR